jgi:hypothetical protein
MSLGQLMRRAVTYMHQAGADGSNDPLPSRKKFSLFLGPPTYMFRPLLAHPQEAPHKWNLVYCTRMSVDCGTVATMPQSTDTSLFREKCHGIFGIVFGYSYFFCLLMYSVFHSSAVAFVPVKSTGCLWFVYIPPVTKVLVWNTWRAFYCLPVRYVNAEYKPFARGIDVNSCPYTHSNHFFNLIITKKTFLFCCVAVFLYADFAALCTKRSD